MQYLRQHRILLTTIVYIGLIILLLVPPICLGKTQIYAITNFNEVVSVLPQIFTNETFKNLPQLSLFLKMVNCIFLLIFLFNKKIRKHFNIYVFCYMLFITLTQNVAYIENKGIVLSSGSFILMLITCFAWLFKVRKDEEHYTINKQYLWMISVILLCIWYPLDINAQFDFSLNPYPHYLSSSMYCFNMPVFISFLMIFYKKNTGLFYEIIGIIALLFSFVTIGINARSIRSMPNCIMHIPLFISAITLLWNTVKEKIKKKQLTIQ